MGFGDAEIPSNIPYIYDHIYYRMLRYVICYLSVVEVLGRHFIVIVVPVSHQFAWLGGAAESVTESVAVVRLWPRRAPLPVVSHRTTGR